MRKKRKVKTKAREGFKLSKKTYVYSVQLEIPLLDFKRERDDTVRNQN